jgi:hypothetical protein
MADEKKDPSGFKVVDRRSFTNEGSRRDDETADQKKAAPPAPVEPTPPSPALHEPEEEVEGEASDFDTLVSYLSTTAMFQLGLIPGPGGERIPSDMVNAQRTIDLLQVLQKKTTGNLTPQESRLLDDVLYELRMTFVEMQKRQARKG